MAGAGGGEARCGGAVGRGVFPTSCADRFVPLASRLTALALPKAASLLRSALYVKCLFSLILCF